MTNEQKTNAIYGRQVEVDILKKSDDGSLSLEKKTLRIYPIQLKDFPAAAEAHNQNDFVGFVCLCGALDRTFVEEQIEPGSFLELYDQCVQLNQNGFFAYLARTEKLAEQNLRKNLKLLDVIHMPEDQKITLLAKLGQNTPKP